MHRAAAAIRKRNCFRHTLYLLAVNIISCCFWECKTALGKITVYPVFFAQIIRKEFAVPRICFHLRRRAGSTAAGAIRSHPESSSMRNPASRLSEPESFCAPSGHGGQQSHGRRQQPQAPAGAPRQPDRTCRRSQRRASPHPPAAPLRRRRPGYPCSSRYSARPPSSGRIGSRLKMQSTALAPAAAEQPSRPRITAASRLASGPASDAASSCP